MFLPGNLECSSPSRRRLRPLAKICHGSAHGRIYAHSLLASTSLDSNWTELLVQLQIWICGVKEHQTSVPIPAWWCRLVGFEWAFHFWHNQQHCPTKVHTKHWRTEKLRGRQTEKSDSIGSFCASKVAKIGLNKTFTCSIWNLFYFAWRRWSKFCIYNLYQHKYWRTLNLTNGSFGHSLIFISKITMESP